MPWWSWQLGRGADPRRSRFRDERARPPEGVSSRRQREGAGFPQSSMISMEMDGHLGGMPRRLGAPPGHLVARKGRLDARAHSLDAQRGHLAAPSPLPAAPSPHPGEPSAHPGGATGELERPSWPRNVERAHLGPRPTHLAVPRRRSGLPPGQRVETRYPYGNRARLPGGPAGALGQPGRERPGLAPRSPNGSRPRDLAAPERSANPHACDPSTRSPSIPGLLCATKPPYRQA